LLFRLRTGLALVRKTFFPDATLVRDS
jgi:hypothetical protein